MPATLGFAGVMALAYGLALSAVLLRCGAAEKLHDAVARGARGVPTSGPYVWSGLDAAFPMYAFDRYPDWARTDGGFYLPPLLLMAGSTILAFVIIRAWSILRVVRRSSVPGSAAHRDAALRCAAVFRTTRRTPAAAWLWFGAAAIGGVSTAFFGDVIAMAYTHFSEEAAWARGDVGSASYIKPVIGSLAAPDAIWCLAWAMLVPAGLAGMVARRRFALAAGKPGRRCFACGYPVPRHPRFIAAQRPVCPECGVALNDSVRALGPQRRFVWFGLMVVLLISAGVFWAGPHVFM